MKIAVIGYSGSGKSTLAKFMGEQFSIPILFLDTIHFLPNWQEREDKEALVLIEDFMQQGSWVIDGNYRNYHYESRLERADYIIFMKFSRFQCLVRAAKRYFQFRGKCRESMAQGCQEKLDWEFIRWILHDGRTQSIQKNDQEICKKYAHKIILIRNQGQLNGFKGNLFSVICR